MATLARVQKRTSNPDPKPVQSPATAAIGRAGLVAWLALAAVLLGSYAETLLELVRRWQTDPDYSHGFFVPVFSGYLLWRNRSQLHPSAGGRWLGALLVLASAAMRVGSGYFNFVLLDPASLLPCLLGIALLVGGWGGLRWSFASIAFLAFMIPLPGFLAGGLSGPLQRIATESSTYVLQTIGVPATSTGNVIWLSNGKIGVVEACSGLRMLVTFLAVTTGAALLMKGAIVDKLVVVLSSLGIAIVVNVVRIAATGLVHEWLSPELAEWIFHDLAGYLMMPAALLLLLGEIWLLERLFPRSVAGPVVTSAAAAARPARAHGQ